MPSAGTRAHRHGALAPQAYPHVCVQVQLLVARLAEFKTDLLVSITRPVAKPAAVAGKPIASEEETAADAALALSILDSIEIKDEGLFGEG